MNATVDLMWTEQADTSFNLPRYTTSGAAGADVQANLPKDLRDNGIVLQTGERILVSTGFKIAVEDGYEVQVRPRSGLALKNGVTVVNSPGTVDCDYRGPLGVVLLNTGKEPFHIKHGDRIAQIVVAPVTIGVFQIVDEFSSTERGSNGYGSTGV